VATCVFCAIAAGEAPGHIVLRDDSICAFLDARPVFKGHVLVVPRTHVVTLPELDESAVAPLFLLVRRIARAVETGLETDGTFVGINNRISQSVPHLHVHVVPRHKGDGLRGFFWPRTKYGSEEEGEAIARRITAALENV
jgi:histidine triad (HIT) family protein